MSLDLNKVFGNAVSTVFSVFKSLIKPGIYVVNPASSGWESGSNLPVEFPMDVIPGGFTQKDKQNLKFYAQILPSDTITMIKGSDVSKNSIKVSSSDLFKIQYGLTIVEFTIVNHDVDSAEALYILLLRQVNV